MLIIQTSNRNVTVTDGPSGGLPPGTEFTWEKPALTDVTFQDTSGWVKVLFPSVTLGKDWGSGPKSSDVGIGDLRRSLNCGLTAKDGFDGIFCVVETRNKGTFVTMYIPTTRSIVFVIRIWAEVTRLFLEAPG